MKLSFAYWSLVAAGLLGGSAVSVFAADAPTAWQLRSSLETDLSGAYLEELFTNPPAILPRVRLAALRTTCSQTATFTRAQVTELLREHAPTVAATNWAGPAQINVIRRKRSLEEAELKRLLTETLQRSHVKERGELELRFSRPWAKVVVPDDPLTLKILDLPTAGVTPNFIVRFELTDGQETLGQWQLAVQARIWREVWVAGSALPRGLSVRDAHLTQERRDMLALRDALVTVDTDNPALEIGENIQAGTALASRMLRLRPVIRRGKVADALIQEGSLQISVKVEALEDGAPGQTIRVRNLKSKREFRGKVENEETILVPL